jgi:hypothetical protein
MHDPDPKLKFESFFRRSQEQVACLSQVVLLTPQSSGVEWSGVRPIQSSSICSCRWASHPHFHFTLPMQCGVAALLCRCRPAQSDRGEEMNSYTRAEQQHHHDRPGPPTTPHRGPMRQHLYGEEARLIGRYSSGPLVGPRPVPAWPEGAPCVLAHWLGRAQTHSMPSQAQRWQGNELKLLLLLLMGWWRWRCWQIRTEQSSRP